MPRSRTLASLAVAALLGLSACGGDADTAAGDTPDAAARGGGGGGDATVPEPGPGEGSEVFVDTFIFRPDPLTVPVGTTVTFTQLDATTHTITSGTREAPTPERFDARLGQDETFEHTFDEPGTHPYFCSLHNGPGMTGEVVVEAEG